VTSDEVRAGVRTWVGKSAFGFEVVLVVLFASAGTLRWRAGWIYFGLYAAAQIATALVLIPRNPELLTERSKLQPGAKAWDKALLATGVVLGPMMTWVMAGLDRRFGWSADVPPALYAAAVALSIGGNALVIWAMDANRFFSATVRIQKERGHTVVSAGPYAVVRHPGYAGWLLFFLSHPVLLESWRSAIPVAVASGVLVLRAALEDRTLREELDGYREYAARVRYRLVPGLW
jgi:protein-S-isoprenylcysteine O-methyltransferase Ste14